MEDVTTPEKPGLETVVSMLVEGFDRLELGQQAMREDLSRLFKHGQRMENGQQSLRSELKEDIRELRAELHDVRDELKTDISRLDDKLTGEIRRVEGKVDDVAETLADSVGNHEVRITALETRGIATA